MVNGGRCLPVIFHCTAAKDRTGFRIAIMLHALGVSRDTIYRDYLRSTRNGLLHESAAQAMAIHFGAALDASMIDVVAGADALYLDEVSRRWPPATARSSVTSKRCPTRPVSTTSVARRPAGVKEKVAGTATALSPRTSTTADLDPPPATAGFDHRLHHPVRVRGFLEAG
ncbi:tyrosine-protein phosphatase [Paraburkholderia nodosa]|uniref:tyrosine-protein phosphatase n=1 Tax=Paraburkholderia nodosa TaxID=392320 RepID=UPI0009F3F3EE|nr:tyrosine-protein phosphatase [Paraburkholderia nodosa]